MAAKPGDILKTTSGKIRRFACKGQFLAGELKEYGRSITGPDRHDFAVQPLAARRLPP